MQSIRNFADFLATPAGDYLLDWEARALDAAVVDIFGYHALQLGLPHVDALRENRMPLRCLALEGAGSLGRGGMAEARREVAVVTSFEDLPFAAQSLDLVVLPHVLEFAQEPHRVLREVERVLVPEGQVVIIGFNPASLWGAHHWLQRAGVRPYLPRSSQLIALPRLKDWLKLLSFDVHRGQFGAYLPSVRSPRWIQRLGFLDKAGDRWWPVLGNVYLLTAIKRVRGMRLVGLARHRREERRPALAPVIPIANGLGVPPRRREPVAAARGVEVVTDPNDPKGGRRA